MMADEDLYLDDAYAFLLQQTRLQQHRHHNLTPNSKLAMKQGKLTNKTANKAMLAQSQLARLHQELLHQQQSHSNDMAAMSTTLGYDATEVSNEHTNNAAMATAAAALSLCALDGSQPLLLQNVPQAVNTLPKLPPRIIKILYVDSELEEKEAAVKLEEVTSVLYEQHDGGVICSFTVIANNMAALESTEHVDYDAIFVAEGRSLSYNFVNKRGANGNNKNSNKATGGDTSEIAAYDILRILRMVGSTTPVILLTSSHDLAYSNSIYKSSTPGLPAIGFHTCTDRFAAVLQRPYRSKDICHIISQIIATNTSDSETITGDSLSELDELTGKESHNRARAEPLSKAPRTSASSASINSSSSNTLPALSAFHHTTSSTSTSSSVYTLMGQYAGSRFQNNGSGKGHNT